MEPKKSKTKSIERYTGVFTDLGLLVALAFVFMAFKWNSTKPSFALEDPIEIEIDGDLQSPITKEPDPAPPKELPKEIKEPTPFIPPRIVPTQQPVPFDTSSFEDPMDIDDNDLYANAGIDTLDVPVPSYQLNEMPSFPGGNAEFAKFLRSNLEFPRLEREYGIGGKVHLKFEIDKKGNVTNLEILKGSTDNFDKEALRVGGMIPKWEPGIQNGKPVRCWFVQVITFKAT